MQKVLIIGAFGQMGQWFLNFFEAHTQTQWDVHGIDKQDWAQIDNYLSSAHIVFVSVPLSKSGEVLQSLSRKMRAGQLLCDISSLKESQMKAMENSSCEILGLHPLFGPMTKTLLGQRILYCNSPGEKGKLLLDFFKKHGAILEYMPAEKHDQMMAYIQALTYGQLFALGDVYRKDHTSIETLLPFSTPMYRMMTSMLGRLFTQSSELYGAITLGNPHAKSVLTQYRDSLTKLLEMEPAIFEQEFTKIADSLGAFTQCALEQSERALQVYVSPLSHHAIVCRKLEPIAVQEKGKTYEWCKNLPGLQISFYERAKGALFACHYHTGSDPSKNPERFLILSGTVEVSWKELSGGHGKFVAHAPSEILVGPYVYHEFRALEPVLFIEYRSTVYDPQNTDSYTLEEFQQLLNKTSQ